MVDGDFVWPWCPRGSGGLNCFQDHVWGEKAGVVVKRMSRLNLTSNLSGLSRALEVRDLSELDTESLRLDYHVPQSEQWSLGSGRVCGLGKSRTGYDAVLLFEGYYIGLFALMTCHRRWDCC